MIRKGISPFTRLASMSARCAALAMSLGIATAARAASLTEADVSSGSLTLTEDSTLTISSATSLDALAVSGAYTLTIDSASAATLTLTTLDIGSGTTVKLADSATLASGAVTATTVTGAGVIAYTGVEPDALASWTDADNWTGTVWVRGLSKNGWNPTSLGNAQSTLRISGYQGYFAQALISVPFAIELENDSYSSAANINNGFSYNSTGKAYFATPTLKGSGTYTANTTGGSLFIVTTDWSEFTGTFSLSGKTVWLGCAVPDGTYTSDDVTLGTIAGAIRIAEGKEVTITPSAGWTFASGGGFIGEGTVKLLYPWQATANLAVNTNFTGTVELAACQNDGTSSVAVYPARMGNAGSKIKFDGLAVGSNSKGYYFSDLTSTAAIEAAGNVLISDGSSNKSYSIGSLTGTGDFGFVTSLSGSKMTIGCVTNYTGTLSASSGSAIVISELALSSAPSTGDMIVKVDSANPAVTIAKSEGDYGVTYNDENIEAAVALNTVGEDYGYTITAIRRDVYWIGGENGDWGTASNWALEDGTVLSACPSDTTYGAGDHVIFTNAASVAIGNRQATVSRITLNADVTFTGYSLAQSNGLFFDTMDGTGKFTMNKLWVATISEGSSRNVTIYNDVCVTGNCYFNGASLVTQIYGDLTGDGLLAYHGKGGESYTLRLHGDNTEFAGTVQLVRDGGAYDRIWLDGGAASSSSNAVWKFNCYAGSGTSSQNTTYVVTSNNETYYFGGIDGGLHVNGYNAHIEIGAREDFDSTFTYQTRATRQYGYITKVGSGKLTLCGTPYYITLKGGETTLGTSSSKLNYGTYSGQTTTIVFAGEGASLIATPQTTDSVTTNPDISAYIKFSTYPIAFNTDGNDFTWATALAASNTGGLTKMGEGTLTLTAIPAYTGTTRVEAGTLIVPLGTQLGDVYVAEGATLTFDLADTTSSGALASYTSKTGDGSVTLINAPEDAAIKEINGSYVVISGSRTLTWSGASEADDCWTTAANWLEGEEEASAAPTYYDAVVFNTATPVVTNAAAVEVLSVTAPNGLTLTNDYAITVYGDFAVTGAFVKEGKGMLTVEGAFSATEGTTITQGAIKANLETAQSVTFDPVSAYTYGANMTSYGYTVVGNNKFNSTPSDIGGNGYGVKFITPNADLLTVSGNGVVEAESALAVTSGSFAGTMTGEMSLSKTGSGTYVLFGNQTFEGDVTVADGTLKLATPYDLDGLRADYDASDDSAFEFDEDGETIVKWSPSASMASYTAFLTNGYHSTHYTTTEAPVRSSDSGYYAVKSDKFLMSEEYGTMSTKNDNFIAKSFFFVATSTAGNLAGNWEFGSSNPPRWNIHARNSHLMRYGNGTWAVGGFWENGYLAAQNNSYGGVPYPTSRAVISAVNNTGIIRGESGRDNRMFIGGTGADAWSEFLTYTRELSFDEKAAVEQYLMAKWGINSATYAALPATADVTVAAGATLDLGGQTVTVAGLNLAGTITNGTLIVDGEITLTGSPTLDATIIRAGDTESETIIVPGSTSVTEYATEEEAAAAAENYAVVLTSAQEDQGLDASYYTTAVVAGETEGTYVVTVVLNASEVAPEIDTSSEPMTVAADGVTFAVDTTSLKTGLYYGIGTRTTPDGEVTYGGMTLFTGSNAGDIDFTADLPTEGVKYYTIEASDTDLSPNP